MSTHDDPYVRVGSVADASDDDPHVVTIDGQAIGLFHHDDAFFATDLRCPHMGFPLTEGTVEDGILTCPWHHARFDLACGDTLDPFADDVQTFPVEIRDGDVFVDPTPERDRPPAEHWGDRLEHGLQENISLIIAKAVIGLDDAGVDPTEAVDAGVRFGTQYRADGWGRGLTTLGVMANLHGFLRPEDGRRALYAGLGEVASECAGEPPWFDQDPLSNTSAGADRYTRWFRDAIEVRDDDGAERILKAAIAADLPRSTIADMVVAATTDHLYLDTGHRLDFTNKAFETLDHVGWERAETVLASLVPGLADANRAEEEASWRQPDDLAALCFEAAEALPDDLEAGAESTWREPEDLVETVLGDDPAAIVEALRESIASGASATDLAGVVTYAGARRIAQFGTSNEFRDWNTVHHTYTYLNAVDGLARRTDGPEIYRALFDGAMNVYLDRFLNTPPQAMPDPAGDGDPDGLIEDLDETFEVEGRDEVDRAGRLTAQYLASGGDPDRLMEHLGAALVREDAGFHPRQNVEAAFTQFERTDDPERARVHLLATARYLAAHTPTRRAGEQTYDIADRLHRGQRIHESEDGPAG